MTEIQEGCRLVGGAGSIVGHSTCSSYNEAGSLISDTYLLSSSTMYYIELVYLNASANSDFRCATM